MKNKLVVENLQFSYKNKLILNNICFECNTGVTALLGNNGAGKTTLLNILAGLKKSNKGKIIFNGKELTNSNYISLKDIGYLPQGFEIYPNVTGYDFLSYICDLKELSKLEKKNAIDYVIEKFNLESVIKTTFNKYSGGFKRRLGIAQAVIGDPKLLLIDEPTVGLDPEQRLEFRYYLSNIGKKSTTLVSTHIIEDAELCSDNVLILDSGKIIFNGTINNIIDIANKNILTLTCNTSEIISIRNDFVVLEERRIGNDKIEVKIINTNSTKINNSIISREVSLENAYVYIKKQQNTIVNQKLQ